MERKRLELCQDAIGYRFRDPALLARALTHSSNKPELGSSNERLEFLGDAILGMVVSEHLFNTYPEHTEGDLTTVKSVVVSQRTLARQGRALRLDEFLSVGRGMTRGRRLPNSVVANVLEALVAAVYLDRGFEAARRFVLRLLALEIEQAEQSKHKKNFKSVLQQLVQRECGCTPAYRVIEESGPDHAKSFRVVTLIGGVEYGTGWGHNKKEAEQHSARESLALVKERGLPDLGQEPEEAGEEPARS